MPKFTLAPLLRILQGIAIGLHIPAQATAEPTKPSPVQTTGQVLELVVHKSPSCSCCNAWVEHLEKAGFTVTPKNTVDTARVKRSFGIEPEYGSCHTGVSAGGYVFEGHVPAKYIQRFLKEKPAGAIGLSVPGMPLGSPGMEVGGVFEPYQVLLLMKGGKHKVYADIPTYQSQF